MILRLNKRVRRSLGRGGGRQAHCLSVAAVALCLFLIGCAAGSVNQKAASTPVAEKAAVSGDWGIEILAIRQSAAGYMLDMRYKVIDAEKAIPIFDRKVRPYLIDQASGAKFAVPNPPKTGPLRTSDRPQAGRNYFIFFANPGRFIKPGSKVTVVIGDFRAENLTVE